MKRSVKHCIPLIYAICQLLASCSGEYQKNSGIVWGTTYNISYSSEENLSDSIVKVMRGVELSLSMFDSCSTIARINRCETDRVDPMICEVFECSRLVNQWSNGAFDPTIAPLVELWGFGRDRGQVQPDSLLVAAALKRVGISRCEIRDGCLSAPVDSMSFDFSAIAKGYGVDCVGEMLTRQGIENYMVEIGGEIRVKGKNSQGKPWRIQIDAPESGDSDTPIHQRLTVVELTDCALATSGNYRNYHETAEGERYGHTISPLTGYPVKTHTLSVTIIASECMLADALATACMAMPLDQAIAMIEGLNEAEGQGAGGVGALFVTASDEGYELYVAGRWPGLTAGDRG